MRTRKYTIEKTVWSDADYEQMSWHDSHVYAIAFRSEVLELWLDIDYIFHWDGPHGADNHFTFWVAPATLVFEGAYDFTCKIATRSGVLSLQEIARSGPKLGSYSHSKLTEWCWRLEFNEGEIRFRAAGYSQFTRRRPAHLGSQTLAPGRRGGISFGREYAA